MKTFNLKIYASDHTFFDGQCESLIVPIEDGMMGVLASHSNLITAVEPGELTYRPAGDIDKKAVVTDGMMKIEDGDVMILAFRCEDPDEVDLNTIIREEEERLRRQLEKTSLKEFKSAEASLSRALNSLKKKNKSGL